MNAKFNGYRNGEYLQFMTNVLNVYQKVDTKKLLLEQRVNDLSQFVEELDMVFMNPKGHKLTTTLNLLDEDRLKALRSIKLSLQSTLLQKDVTKLQSAELLLNIINQQVKGIDNFSYQQKTAILNALLKDLNYEATLIEAITSLNLTEAVKNLEESTKLFDVNYFLRATTGQVSIETNLKKRKILKAYRDLTRITIAFSDVAEDKLPYNNIIDELNSVIETNNLPVSLRKSNRKKEIPVVSLVEEVTDL